MNQYQTKLTMLTAVSATILFGGVVSAGERPFAIDGAPQALTGQATEEGGMYIVRLQQAPVATYEGGVQGLKATNPRANGKVRLDTNSKDAKAYAKFLRDEQKSVLGNAGKAFGRDLETAFDYQHAFNGFAVELSVEEARAMRKMEGVVSVDAEQMYSMDTDSGPAWIGAPEIWVNPPNSTQGEGVVVAVLDSGINSDHPSFADIGGDGYDHTNPLGSGNYLPGSYCETTDATFCNDKLIGAHSFVPGDLNYPSPEDSDGHGSHTASTAAGNVVNPADFYAPTTTASFAISGVAPHANVIAYDVCVDSCPSSAIVAAINQMIIDASELPNGIAAMNFSISGGTNPYNEANELGFLAAVEAGIYVATSGGNSGPDAGTVGHQGPWTSATAATTHDRAIVNSVVNLNSDGGGLADIAGLGLTSGYGPAPIINSADLPEAGAELCGLGEQGDFISPWPGGTFSGEIVACTRGTYGRIEKGANVLAAGAGGFILIDNGSGLSADAHVLPGVHISQADGAALAAWITANAGNNPMASISGYSVESDPGFADVVAGFSSRGPGSAGLDVLKPDVGAPGVAIFAAAENGNGPAPEYQFLQGTSMASPHNAGAAALMAALHPDWTPQEIKSAIMMTASTEFMVKEDGFTPADAFDIGAGRIDLGAAKDAGLVMSESIQNFEDANPALGGDPKTLNVASMMDSACLGECSWSRTVTNPAKSTSHWNVTASSPAGVDISVEVSPEAKSDDYNLKLKKGKDGTIDVTADTSFAPEGWYFGSVDLDRNLDKGPDLHMPVAVYAAKSTNPNIFNKTVDVSTAEAGDILNYEISIVNGPYAGVIDISDLEPADATLIPGSASVVINNGVEVTPVDISGGELTWSGMLDQADVSVVSDPFPPAGSPFGYVDLASLGVSAQPCSSVCDDTSILFGLPPYQFDGKVYSTTRVGSNGLIVPGGSSASAFTPFNQDFPDATAPNVIAPFWTDLDLDGTNVGDTGAGFIYVATFFGGAFTIIEWKDVEIWGQPGVTYTFQVQIGNIGSGYEGIWFVYNDLPAVPAFLTVGAEDETGSRGFSYYYDGAGTFPIVGDLGDLKVVSLPGGDATISFQAEAICDSDGIVNRAELSHGGDSESAIAGTACE